VKKAFTPMKKKATKGVMDGVPLTQEGVCQVDKSTLNKMEFVCPVHRRVLSASGRNSVDLLGSTVGVCQVDETKRFRQVDGKMSDC